jgi:hypothetical protein
MKRFLSLASLALLVFVLPVLAGPTVPHKESCDGVLTNVIPPSADAPGEMDFVGVGKATHMGQYHIVGGHLFTPEGDLVGAFTSTAADGSTISGTYEGVFFPIGGTLYQFEVSVDYLVGTGRLAGVTGHAETVAILDAATGEFHYDTLGTWTLP